MTKQMNSGKASESAQAYLLEHIWDTDYRNDLDITRAFAAGYEKGREAGREWIPVSERLPEPCHSEKHEGPVLVVYLEPFFGGFTEEMGVAYYDHPEDYEDPKDGRGWLFWLHDTPVRGGGVTHWQPLPPAPEALTRVGEKL